MLDEHLEEELDAADLLYQLTKFHFTLELEWMYEDGLTLLEIDPHLAKSINQFIKQMEGCK